MSVAFIGLGLNNERGLTIEGIEQDRRSSNVFAEFYTNIMPGLDRRKLELLLGKRIVVLNRFQLEDEGGRQIVGAAERGRVAFLVPGDPMIATTHISIRLELARKGIPSRIIHGPSIVSAVCGATGLQSYKFGKSITVPRDQPLPKSVLDTVSDNSDRGLHTLILLDVQAGKTSQMRIRDASRKVTTADPRIGTRV